MLLHSGSKDHCCEAAVVLVELQVCFQVNKTVVERQCGNLWNFTVEVYFGGIGDLCMCLQLVTVADDCSEVVA